MSARISPLAHAHVIPSGTYHFEHATTSDDEVSESLALNVADGRMLPHHPATQSARRARFVIDVHDGMSSGREVDDGRLIESSHNCHAERVHWWCNFRLPE